MSEKNAEKFLEELKEYEKNNETLAKYKSPLVFENFDSPHASIVLKNIVNFSEREVMIYDRDLRGDLTGDLVDGELVSQVEGTAADDELVSQVEGRAADAEHELKNFLNAKRVELLDSFERHLKSGKNLFIVIDNIGDKESTIYRKLTEWQKEYPFFLSVTLANDEFKEAVANLQDVEKRKISYMAVGDTSSYRVQIKTSEEQYLNSGGLAETLGRSAFVCYNDPETAKKLSRVFKKNSVKNSIFSVGRSAAVKTIAGK